MKNRKIEVLSRHSIMIKGNENEDENIQSNRNSQLSYNADLSMAEKFYYEVISSFEQEEVYLFTLIKLGDVLLIIISIKYYLELFFYDHFE